MNNWITKELSRQVHQIEFNDVHSGWTQDVLLMSDEHWDNKKCCLDILKRHHEEAKAKNAPILKFGDLFCAMQGKWDKRADQDQLREEHRGNSYLDKLVETAHEWYKPYVQQIALITPGNHEQSIVDRHQTNLTDRLVTLLKQDSDNVYTGDYWGYVKFRFNYGKGRSNSVDLHYHHGYGGGGEVTRGLIDNSRTRSQYDADVFYSGHIHRRNMDENIVTAINKLGNIISRRQLFLRGSTYKNETTGWHAAKGRSSRPIGGWWLRFTVTKNSDWHVTTEAISAI